jgi:hypothetical protein
LDANVPTIVINPLGISQGLYVLIVPPSPITYRKRALEDTILQDIQCFEYLSSGIPFTTQTHFQGIHDLMGGGSTIVSPFCYLSHLSNCWSIWCISVRCCKGQTPWLVRPSEYSRTHLGELRFRGLKAPLPCSGSFLRSSTSSTSSNASM